MSDLFCAATVLVARHGDAEYVETGFSDEGGWLTAQGRAQARALAAAVAGRKVARIFTSDTSRAVQTAEIVAAALRLAGDQPVVAHKALREVFIGDLLGGPFDLAALRSVTTQWFAGDLSARFPGGEDGAEVVARYAAEFDAIADEHRGETVLVIAHQNAAGIAVPSLARNARPSYVEHHRLANGAFAELSGDSDGWRLDSWPSAAEPATA